MKPRSPVDDNLLIGGNIEGYRQIAALPSSLTGVYGLMTGFSASGALYLVMMAAFSRQCMSLVVTASQLALLTSHVQAADLIFLRQIKSEALGIVVDNFDV
jgi:hypothetical protein